jgi:hypothetical protein
MPNMIGIIEKVIYLFIFDLNNLYVTFVIEETHLNFDPLSDN